MTKELTSYQQDCIAELKELKAMGVQVPRKAFNDFNQMDQLEAGYCDVRTAVDLLIATN